MKPIIETDVFKEMVKGSPRLLAMLQWRKALGKLDSSDQVAQMFMEDWNQVEELYKRLANSLEDEK